MKTITKVWISMVIGFGGVYLYACPYLTFYSIGKAINNKDVVSLSNNIDFPTLQNNLKEQLKYYSQKQQANSQDIWFNMGFEIGKFFNSYFIDKMVEKNINAMSFANSNLANSNYDFTSTQIQYKYNNLSTFSVNLDGGKVEYILTRNGLDWNLTNIIFTESFIEEQIYINQKNIEAALENFNDSLNSLNNKNLEQINKINIDSNIENYKQTNEISTIDMRGRWEGYYNINNVSSFLDIYNQSNHQFSGELTTVSNGNNNSIVILDIEGEIDYNSKQVIIREVSITEKADKTTWYLGFNEGYLTSDFLTMSGTGKDKKGHQYSWSFTKQ